MNVAEIVLARKLYGLLQKVPSYFYARMYNLLCARLALNKYDCSLIFTAAASNKLHYNYSPFIGPDHLANSNTLDCTKFLFLIIAEIRRILTPFP